MDKTDKKECLFEKGLYLLQIKKILNTVSIIFLKEALLIYFQLLDMFKRNGLCQVDIIHNFPETQIQ